MRKLPLNIFLFAFVLFTNFLNAQVLDGNNIKSYFFNTGIFDRNDSDYFSPGFEWPKGSGNHAIFTAGLTIAAKVSGVLKMAAASYEGEYAPGYANNEKAFTNPSFKIYKVKRGDNQFNNPDYANWVLMVPYGAPFVDVNKNGIYEASIDTPGVSGATQTLFLCMTDGFQDQHNSSEGFGGGTTPLYAEVHMTAWCYNYSGLSDVQFIKWDIINKSTFTWNGAIFSIVSDPDLGSPTDDWIGCDTLLNMGYCYNSDNNDGNGNPGTYGVNPPAVAIKLLKTPVNQASEEFGLTSFVYFTSPGIGGIICERDPNSPVEAYNYMKGLKSDVTKWVNPLNMRTTKYCYPGDPETGLGWTESDGKIGNCGSDTTGVVIPSPGGDRRMVINIADSLNKVSPGGGVTIAVAQLIARGSNNLNSVTQLKMLANNAQNFWQTISKSPVSPEVPEKFILYQNYPNPFNPSTRIKFDIPKASLVRLTVYDILGRQVAELVNQSLNVGVYEYEWSVAELSSGIYFYKLESGDFTQTKRMVLVK